MDDAAQHRPPPDLSRHGWAPAPPARAILDPHAPWQRRPLFSERRAEGTLQRGRRRITALGEGRPFLVVYYGTDGAGGWHEDVAEARRERRRAILAAAELDPNDPLAMLNFGNVLFDDGNRAAACSAFERALAAGRTNADALALAAKYVAGILERPAEAPEIMERALRLNPYAPPWYHMNKLRVCYMARDYPAALEAARRSPEAPITRLFEALSLAGIGRSADAAHAMPELRRRYPNFDPASIMQQPWINSEKALRQFRGGLEALEDRMAL